jgi:hypothetical protein
MDKHLNNEEIKLQSLIEEKDFCDLNEQEQSLVLTMLTQKEYVLQRKIILESQEIYKDKKLVAPPLLITSGASTSFWFKKAPIYQTLLAVAATVLLMFILTRPDNSLVEKEVVTEYITQVDTVVETKIINDTFVKYVDKPVIVETVKYIEVPSKEVVNTNVTYANNDEVGRVLEPANNISLPDLNEPKTSSSASSFKNDPTSILVVDFVLNN